MAVPVVLVLAPATVVLVVVAAGVAGMPVLWFAWTTAYTPTSIAMETMNASAMRYNHAAAPRKPFQEATFAL